MKYLIDAFSWIEYLEGSSKGERVSNILKSDNEIFVLPLTIGEVVSKTKRKDKNHELAYESITKRAKIISTTPRMAKEAGLLHAEMRKKFSQFGIVDALLVITARNIKARILTGDNHLKQFAETEFL